MSPSVFHQTKAIRISSGDLAYPALLRESTNFPDYLWVKGNPDVLRKTCATVVGTRKITAYGRQALQVLLPSVIDAGIVIVSGLAIGVDAFAHELVVKKKGQTIAVLAQGITSVYPKMNEELADQILLNGGVILSEFDHTQPGQKYLFPRRNRILAGLSMVTLVVEAGIPSGSLITANHAVEYGRSVLAVPGPITNPYSEGTKKLINLGAELVTSAEDILRAIGSVSYPAFTNKSTPKHVLNASDIEDSIQQRILESIQSKGGVSLDVLQKELSGECQNILHVISEMEIKGLIYRSYGEYRMRCV